jgi:hypothetical protein
MRRVSAEQWQYVRRSMNDIHPPYSQATLLKELRKRRRVIERRGGDNDPREPLDELIVRVEAEQEAWKDAHPLGDGREVSRWLPLAMVLVLPLVLIVVAANPDVNPNQWSIDWGKTVKLTLILVYGGAVVLKLGLPLIIRAGNWFETRDSRRG